MLYKFTVDIKLTLHLLNEVTLVFCWLDLCL